MNNKPLRPCNKNGCPNITRDSYCEQHKISNADSNRYYDKYKRNKESRSFYKSTAWAKCRMLAMSRDNHLCQDCYDEGRITMADMVHHIKHLKDYPELGLTLDNLRSLCNTCHNKQHPNRSSEKKQVSKKINVIKAVSNPEIVE